MNRAHPLSPWLFSALLCLLLTGCGAGTAFAQVRLMEFLTVNSGAAGYVDEDGEPHGWIEVWNSSPTALVTLTNYKLVSTLPDGTARTWAFPNVRLEGNERLVIWASGKNRTSSTAPLHTNFTLPPGGGTLALTNASPTPANLTLFATYPAQTPDVSYGRDESESGVTPVQVGFYSVPTPGEANNFEGPGVAGEVVFSELSKAYTGSLTVTLSLASPDPGTEIRYTTNRAAPTASSSLYTEPLTVSTTQMIRARAYKTGLLPGKIASEAYLLLNDNAQSFASTMPVVVVTNFLATVPPDTKTDQAGFMWVWQPPIAGQQVRVADPPTFASRVRISRRGSSTLNNPKWNLDMEIRNAYNDEELDHALLGMPAHSDWILHAPYNFDRSLMHNPLAYSLSNAIGRYAPRHAMAEVFLDFSSSSLSFTNTASGDYFGVYNILEKIRRSGERANISRLDPYDNDTRRISGGYMWKVDRADASESFTAGGVPGTGGIGMAHYYPNGEQMKSPQRDPQEQYLIKYLDDFNAALQAGNKDPNTGWPAYLEQLPTIDHHLINTWSFNVDALRLSGYWTKDRDTKMYAGPVWDFDRALSSTDGRDSNPAIWRATTGDFGTDYFNKNLENANDAVSRQTPIWWHTLFRDVDFYQAYIDRWQELRRGPLARSAVNELIDSINAGISAQAVTRDLARWNQAKRSWSSSLTPSTMPASQAAEVQRLKDFLQLRANFFDTQWVGPVTADVPPGLIAPGTQVTLTGPANSVIYYTLDGTDPRPAGGALPGEDAAHLYSGPITLAATTSLRARAYKESHTALTGVNRPPLKSNWSGLTSLFYTTDQPAAPGDLVITEIHFNPASPTAAELAGNPLLTGNSFEFVELRNVGSQAVDLRGVRIANGVQYTFAGEGALSLAPGGFVIVASDPAAFPLRYPGVPAVHGPWAGNLSNGGETLEVFAASNSLIQTIAYNDAWAPEADGAGKSLVVYDQAAPAESYGTAANWRASAADGGSPGAVDPSSLVVSSVSAGPDLSGYVTGVALAGTVNGEAPAAEFIAWSKVSGPGDASFEPANALATTASFTQPGLYTLKLALSAPQLTGEDEVQVLAQDSLASWQARYPGIGEPTDDADYDGLPNLVEYAFASHPAVSDQASTLVFALEDGKATLTFPRRKGMSSVTYQIETSSDLADFTPVPQAELSASIVSETDLLEVVKFTYQPASGGPEHYLRVSVSVPAAE